jgi:hypothetical protein
VLNVSEERDLEQEGEGEKAKEDRIDRLSWERLMG